MTGSPLGTQEPERGTRAGASTDFGDLSRGTLRGRPFRVTRAAVVALLRAVVGLRIEGLERVPPTGGLLVICNHLHNADPILLAASFPRPLHFMAKKELFAIPVVGPIIRGVGAFPVDRGRADRWALRRAEATLAQGIAVAMFPEGTRSTTGALQVAHPGAALLALRSGVPVIAMGITGTERLPGNGRKGVGRRRARWARGTRVRFGEPFSVPREVDGRRLTADDAIARMMAELAAVLPPAYRGVYGDD